MKKKPGTNGFVDRPQLYGLRRGRPVRQLGKAMTRLIATADNGKAIVWPKAMVGGQRGPALRRRGLRAHVAKQPDGTYLAWVEKIPASTEEK